MRYTKEFKLECVHKYINGEHIENPGGCTRKNFMDKLRNWVAIYNALGEAGLDHKKPKLTFEDKLEICRRVDNGEAYNQIAISYGRQESFISSIYKKYLKDGPDGLKSNKRGRPPMKEEKSPQRLEDITDPKEREKFLMDMLEKVQIENEYLKKLNALVQKRMDQQQKKK
ncbi:MAG: hypothetical protein HUJ53_07180 [Holdemanella sp.]|nr:hypothetical protein [Holdemanella sp.]